MIARMRRAVAVSLVALLGLSGCGSGQASLSGQQTIAGGATAGVYYNYGAQLARVLQPELGTEVRVVETQGSVDNLRRVGSGQALLGFAQGDTAADAVSGSGAFDEPLPIRAVARVYDEYVHVVVPADSDAKRIADLAGRRVSLGAEDSGVQVIATRVLDAAGVAAREVRNPVLGLEASIGALERGEIDGFFWVGGVPTPSIELLAEHMPIKLLPIDSAIVERVNADHAGVYRLADFPVGIYGTEAQGVTMTVPNYLITSESAPDDAIYGVVRTLFDERREIARSVAAAEYLDRRQAIFTEPVALHPGAARYYVDSHL